MFQHKRYNKKTKKNENVFLYIEQTLGGKY